MAGSESGSTHSYVWNPNILVPTDFSDASEGGVIAGARLLREQGGRATLVHVLSVPDLHIDEGQITQAHPEHAELEAAVHQHLDRLREEHYAGIEGVKTMLIRSASPADAICRLAEEQESTMIVMATHGRRGISRFFAGSVTERVVRHSTCPVLVYR